MEPADISGTKRTSTSTILRRRVRRSPTGTPKRSTGSSAAVCSGRLHRSRRARGDATGRCPPAAGVRASRILDARDARPRPKVAGQRRQRRALLRQHVVVSRSLRRTRACDRARRHVVGRRAGRDADRHQLPLRRRALAWAAPADRLYREQRRPLGLCGNRVAGRRHVRRPGSPRRLRMRCRAERGCERRARFRQLGRLADRRCRRSPRWTRDLALPQRWGRDVVQRRDRRLGTPPRTRPDRARITRNVVERLA